MTAPGPPPTVVPRKELESLFEQDGAAQSKSA